MTTARRSKSNGFPRKVTCGRISVSVYRRKTPSGGFAFMVANYRPKEVTQKDRLGNTTTVTKEVRCFDCYATEADALSAADVLARRLSTRDVKAAAMTDTEAHEYAGAVMALKRFNVALPATITHVTECLEKIGTFSRMREAVDFYLARNKSTTRRRIREVADELIDVKRGQGASERYLQDLRSRLFRFADDFEKDACDITTADIQSWLEGQKLKRQNYINYRRVLHLLFRRAVTQGYAVDNPVENVEKLKKKDSDVEIFTPTEIARLLASASTEFLPCLAIGAFAGLRSAEIERLEWSDIDLTGRHITIGANRAKTGSRRVVPIHDNLAEWLAPYAKRSGKVWVDSHDAFYDAQQETAANTVDEANKLKPVKWKTNALRHSYASYRFAQLMDAGRVAGELGNTAAVVHKHYRELVKLPEAKKWFSIVPTCPENVTQLPQAADA